MDDRELWELYEAETTAYYRYVAAAGGDALVTGQRVTKGAVNRARRAWDEAHLVLRAAASTVEVAAMLTRRAGEWTDGKETKRG